MKIFYIKCRNTTNIFDKFRVQSMCNPAIEEVSAKMDGPTRHLGLRIEAELHYKLKCIADYEGRSLSGLIHFLLQRQVRAYERARGPICTPFEQEDA